MVDRRPLARHADHSCLSGDRPSSPCDGRNEERNRTFLSRARRSCVVCRIVCQYRGLHMRKLGFGTICSTLRLLYRGSLHVRSKTERVLLMIAWSELRDGSARVRGRL